MTLVSQIIVMTGSLSVLAVGSALLASAGIEISKGSRGNAKILLSLGSVLMVAGWLWAISS